jgi:hypothetical protein
MPVRTCAVQKSRFAEALAQVATSMLPKTSFSEMGSSNAAHFKWFTRISRLSGCTKACSGDRSKK